MELGNVASDQWLAAGFARLWLEDEKDLSLQRVGLTEGLAAGGGRDQGPSLATHEMFNKTLDLLSFILSCRDDLSQTL